MVNKQSKYNKITQFYSGSDLGATYTKEMTRVKVWAPTASKVICHLQGATELFEPMEKGAQGVWSLELIGDYERYSYVYQVFFDEIMHTATDPYAIASTPNHERTVIIDRSKIKIDSLKSTLEPLQSYTDSIIYEVHVRDFSNDISSGMKHKGKFLAFTESGTTTQNGLSTGIDYIKSLGVTHVQLLPVYDFGSVDELNPDSSYNWGYDPVQYNVPEGSYAILVDDPYSRIIELKQAIQYLHKQGLRVIMDVVYNHMFDKDASAFEKIVPGYYFRQNELGETSNGSFCGNDLDSTQIMTRQFLLQSTRWWIEEYGFDGFRFDLMGILDIETMNQIAQQTRELDPSAMIYGEGWNMPTFLDDSVKAMMMNHKEMPFIAYFNDIFREKIKGGTLEDKFLEGGFGAGDMSKVVDAMYLLQGTVVDRTAEGMNASVEEIKAYFSQPSMNINYVECHDNHTLWDKMQLSLPEETEEIRKKRQLFMMGFILLSQGIPFLHGGQEFLRTKDRDHNSYKSSDTINKMDWNRKDSYLDVVEQVKQFIKLRKMFKELRLNTTEEILEYTKVQVLNNNVIQYTLKPLPLSQFKNVVLLFNPNTTEVIVPPSNLEGAFELIFTPQGFSKGYESNVSNERSTHIKNQEVTLAPLGIYCLRQ